MTRPRRSPGAAPPTSTRLTAAQFDVFQALTRRPFLILDTEYTTGPKDGDTAAGGRERIISYGLVRIDRGQQRTDATLYKVMNPGVPITEATTAIHGFTDRDVTRRRPFGFHAAALLDALALPDAILVTHTGNDVRILRAELNRTVGRSAADLPLMPLLDTSVLARALRYPGGQSRGTLGLAALCALTGVTNAAPHHARADAEATATALLALLRHAARTGTYLDIDDLLADHQQGTTHEPAGATHISSRGPSAAHIPAAHLRQHEFALPDDATAEQLDAWVERAQQCAELRCPWLRDEAVAAAPHHAHAVRDPLTQLLPALNSPGQSSTLLGALYDLITPDNNAARPGLPPTQALTWHARLAKAVSSLPRCDTDGSCPDCVNGRSCPRDVIYQPVAHIATLGEHRTLNRDRIKDHLFGDNPNRYINAWTKTQPKMAGYMAWLVVEHQRRWAKGSAGGRRLQEAIDRGLHLHEPRLTLLACEALLTTHGIDTAIDTATTALANRTTDIAYQHLDHWVTWMRQTQAARAVRTGDLPEPHPRRGRPRRLMPANPYLPTG